MKADVAWAASILPEHPLFQYKAQATILNEWSSYGKLVVSQPKLFVEASLAENPTRRER